MYKKEYVMKNIHLPTFLLLLVIHPVWGQNNNVDQLRANTDKQLRALTGSSKGITGYVIRDLTNGEQFAFNQDLVFPQASAIKIPILMEVYKQASEGKIQLTQRFWIKKRNLVGGSGILSEFGDSTSQISIQDLCMLMIVLSDNSATNILIDLVGMQNINATLRSLGLKQTVVARRMLDQEASRKGNENLSSPAEAARIMEILYRGEFINKTMCDNILAILKIPKPGGINSALPDSIPVAFKPGEIPGVATEWAVVFLKSRPYIVVFMENYELENESPLLMKNLSRIAYDYFWRVGAASKYGTYVNPH
jgi:beta-lactamase class A